MNHTPSFVISEFTNPSGEIVHRVAGWLNGKRERKNFPTRTEAAAERQVLEIQRLQSETGVRVAATRLEDAQLKEAEAVYVQYWMLKCARQTLLRKRPEFRQILLSKTAEE